MAKEIVVIDKDLEEIIPGFMDNRKEELVELDAAISGSDFKKLESIGHKLAGNAGSYGFDGLSKIGKELEEVAGQSDLKKSKSCVANVKVYLDSIEIKYE